MELHKIIQTLLKNKKKNIGSFFFPVIKGFLFLFIYLQFRCAIVSLLSDVAHM